MSPTPPPDRCRIVLIAPAASGGEDLPERLLAAASGGDIASLILSQGDMAGHRFQALCEAVVPALQEAGVAVVVDGDSRIAGRVGADGLHVEGGVAEVAEAIERAKGRLMIGTNGGKTRDEALAIGETQPDYVFFGRIGWDRDPEAHNRNLTLGRWWAEMVQIPCIVQAGTALESVEAVAATGADFVGLSVAVLADGVDAREAIARANDILDRTAPRFES